MIGCPVMNEASSEARKATTRPTSSGSRQGRARSPLLRRQLADAAIAADVHYHLCPRIASVQAAGRIPNYEASMGKLFGTELTQRIARTAVSAFGLYSNLWDEADPRAPMAARATRSTSSRSPDDRRGHVRDPAQHHRDARPRAAEELTARLSPMLGPGECPLPRRGVTLWRD